ncbi:hypothetical protein JTE90_005425 [Oedothorax gibbosus]|uniref:Uncharacterized protein n=1 Tax=Oedothorax gibbosus TaxID=931172 RepID=A0AAV6UP77_9ARAC|nr:hypothetical protein JTE90_005425 [Oedothorax gibbosus]
MPSFLSVCLALLKFAIATTNVMQALLIELHNAVERLRDGQYSSITLSTEDKSSDLSLLEPSNSDAVNAEPVASSTESTKSSDFTERFSTTNSGTESVILSEPNDLTIFDPLREEFMPPAFRSPLKSQENCQDACVRFLNEPLLTKNDRIDSMEKIELVIKPTCEFIPQEASISPQMPSQLSSPSLTDSDTPENIKYIEKASRLLMTVSTKPDQEQEYCDINSSTTEFPLSGSQTSATDNEDAAESVNLPQLHIESPSSTENDKSPSKECNTQTSVRFLLPDSHIERESKGFRRESKFRKQPNETSTSEEENERKVSRKRRASPGKFYKSPKKLAETTASKIRGYKLSPQNKSDEKKCEEMLSYENTSATRSLDVEFGFPRKSENATDLLTSKDQKNRNLKSEDLSPRTIEDDVDERASFQQATSKSESIDDTFLKSDSISETTSSVRVGEDIAEGAEEFSSEIGMQEPILLADRLVDSDEKGSLSAPEGKQVSPSFENETFAFQEIAVNSKANFPFKGDASNNSLVKDSTYLDKSWEMSLSGHLELVDAKTILQESKLPENDELASDKNNEKRINEQKTSKLESTLNIHLLLESEQNSNCNVQLETTDQASNEESSKESETLPNEKLINEMSGKDSCREGAKGLASQLENKTEFEESLISDSNKDKCESPNFSTSDYLTDKNLVKNSTLEADTDNFSVLKEVSYQINTVVNVGNIVEVDETFSIGQSKTDEVESMEVSSSSLNLGTIDSQSEEQNPETEKQTGEIESENKNVSSLLSPCKSLSSEGDEESTTSKAAGETSDYQFSNLNSNLKKQNYSKCFFTPVLEELAQRFGSASGNNSPTKPQALLSLELQDKAVFSDLQLSTITTDVNKISNPKNYFNIVLKDLVEKVKSSTVSNSFTSIKDEDNLVPKIEVLSKTSVETSPKTDSTKASILEEAEMKVKVDVYSDNLITDAQNIKQDNLEFELQIVPQPVPCETAIKVENLIINETSYDQSEIKIIDSKTVENELNAPNITPAESNICQLTANQEGNDSYSRCPIAVFSNDSVTVEILPYIDDFKSSMSSTIKALVESTKDDSTPNTIVEVPKDNFNENAVHELTNDDLSLNTHLDITNEYTEKALIEMTNEYFTDNVEETKEGLTKNSLVETAKEETTGSNLVEVSKDDPAEISAETTSFSNGSTLVKMAECDSTENAIIEVAKDDLNENFDAMHDCSVESNSVDTSTNLDSSVAGEASANDKEESSNENKPWKKKQRKSKKKRRN